MTKDRQAQDDRLYVTLSHTVTLNHTVTLHYTVTLSLSKRDSIAYSKSNGSQEATRASFDKLRMTGIDKLRMTGIDKLRMTGADKLRMTDCMSL